MKRFDDWLRNGSAYAVIFLVAAAGVAVFVLVNAIT